MAMNPDGQASPKTRTFSSSCDHPFPAVLSVGQVVDQVQPLTRDQLQAIVDSLPQLGRVQVKDSLGSGGFSSVYAVENLNSGAEYALKVTDPLLTAMRKVFPDESRKEKLRITAATERDVREYFTYFAQKADSELLIAKEISDTQCPNLIPVYYACTLDVSALLKLSYERNLWLIGMPKLVCLDSEEFFTRFAGRINEPMLLKLGSDLCSALQTMDGLGCHGALRAKEQQMVLPANVRSLYIRPDDPQAHLIHRDVKPRNIYLRIRYDQDGAPVSMDFVLGDYGISRIVTPDGREPTQVNLDPFRAPDISVAPTPSSDLYSVAMVMLWLIWKNISEKDFLKLKELCWEIAPFLKAEEAQSPLMPVFARLALWMNTILGMPLISQEDKDRLLQAGCLGICTPELLEFLVGMLSRNESERPCRSSHTMRNYLENLRITSASAAQAALRESTEQLRQNTDSTRNLYRAYTNLQRTAGALDKEKAILAREKEDLQAQNQQLKREVQELLLRQAGQPSKGPATVPAGTSAAMPEPAPPVHGTQWHFLSNEAASSSPASGNESRRCPSQEVSEAPAQFFAHDAAKSPSGSPEETLSWAAKWQRQREEFETYKKEQNRLMAETSSHLLLFCLFTVLTASALLACLYVVFPLHGPVYLVLTILLALLTLIALSNAAGSVFLSEKFSFKLFGKAFVGILLSPLVFLAYFLESLLLVLSDIRYSIRNLFRSH